MRQQKTKWIILLLLNFIPYLSFSQKRPEGATKIYAPSNSSPSVKPDTNIHKKRAGADILVQPTNKSLKERVTRDSTKLPSSDNKTADPNPPGNKVSDPNEPSGIKAADWVLQYEQTLPVTTDAVQYEDSISIPDQFGDTTADYWRKNGTNQFIVYGSNTMLVQVNASDGKVVGSYQADAKINKPTVAKLKDGKWYAFFTADDGRLYKIKLFHPYFRPSPYFAEPSSFSFRFIERISCRRSTDTGCLEKDKFSAPPVVQSCKGCSRTDEEKDIVMVVTHHGCGNSTTNMVHAFDAGFNNLFPSLKQPIWTFNGFGDYSMDYGTNLILDTVNNALFVVTNSRAGRFQPSIFRLNTKTGNMDWSRPYSSIHSKPLLETSSGETKFLYAVNFTGKLFALDPLTGSEHWNYQLTNTPGDYYVKDLSIGMVNNFKTLFVTSSTGTVRAILAEMPENEADHVLWITNFGAYSKAISTPVFDGTLKKLYIGLNSGRIAQLNLNYGNIESYFNVNDDPPSTYTMVYQPLIYLDGELKKIIGLGEKIKRVTIPFSAFQQY